MNPESKPEILFEPIIIGNLKVSGRVFKTATAETRATADGFVSDDVLEFYEPIAEAGTPLIITGNLFVSAQGKSTFRQIGADNPDKISGLKQLADMVHKHGGTIFGQLNHCGRQVLPHTLGIEAVSASNVGDKALGTRPRPMQPDEVRQTAEDYGAAAAVCRKAGFDGVQIHAGHGYLICQFLTPYTNRRTDSYGGSFVKRLRFLLEVYGEVRRQAGEDFPVIAKLNGADYLPGRKGLSNRELVEIARILEQEGLNGLEVTVGHYESGGPMIRGSFAPFFKGLTKEGLVEHLPWPRKTGIKMAWPALALACNAVWPAKQGFNLGYAENFKKRLSIPVICVGGFQTKDAMSRAIDQGRCDAVSVARAMIADPWLYRHLKENTPGPVCNFCNGCIARAGSLPVDCYDPRIRRQKDAMLAKPE
jgi:2,4-dienoyl-CoA reductase-like NADH-dependent reductase (Old Yellow Enzyme family)